MSSIATMSEHNILLRGVSWETYDRLIEEAHPSTRLNYDRGDLEVVSPSHKHEGWTSFVETMIILMTMELGVPIKTGRSTTLRRRLKQKGMEPDGSFWVQSEPAVRAKLDLDFEVDPTPDLALESEVSRSILDRLGILADLDVGEVWRYDGKRLTILVLTESGTYVESTTSGCFPWLPIEEFAAQIPGSDLGDETAWALGFRDWAQNTLRLG